MNGTGNNPSLPAIFKLRGRKWKALEETGSSVSINDVKLKQGYVGNLGKKSKIELEELIIRQDKLLANHAFVNALPDGGKRLKEKRALLQTSLDSYNESSPQPTLIDTNELEWKSNNVHDKISSTESSKTLYQTQHRRPTEPLDSDDDEDPLELLVNHSSDVPMSRGHAAASNTQDIDPSEAIRQELKKLDLSDGAPSSVSSNEKKMDTLNTFSDDFGSKLIVSLENKSKPEKEAFKPFRTREHQHLLPDKNVFSSNEVKTTASLSKNVVFSSSCPQSSSPQIFPTSGSQSNHTFGGPAQFSTNENLTHKSSRKSPLWACENSATGPLNKNTQNFSGVMLLGLRESVELEQNAVKRAKEAHFSEAANRLKGQTLRDPKMKRRYLYRDVNDGQHILDKNEDDLDVFSQHRGMCYAECEIESSDED